MKKFLPALLFLVLPVGIKAQEVYDLKKCIQEGLQQNYDIRIVRNSQEISDNNLTLGNAGYLPVIDLNTGYSGTRNNTTQNLADGDQNKNSGVLTQTLNAGINLNWTVFDGFNIQTNYKRLQELQKMGELNTRQTIENFVSNLVAEYYNYIQQNIRLKNLKYAVKLSQERLRIVETSYQVGAGSRLDLQQAKVDFNSDSSRLVRQYEVLFSSRITLNQIMAVEDIEQLITTTDSIIEFNEFLDKNDLLQKMLSSNIVFLLASKNKNLSILDLKTAQSSYYPYLRINTGYGYTKNIYNTGNVDNQHSHGLSYGATLGFNIFSGFDRKRKIKNARLEIENSELRVEQTLLSIRADLANIWMAYRNNIELSKLERENVGTARDTYSIAMERYKLGTLAGIELREAQNSLLEAEERLVQAEYNTKLCEISLMQISGQIMSYFE